MNKTNTPTPEEARAIASDAKFHCKDSENPRPVQTDSSVEDATAILTALVSNPSEAEEIPDAKYFPATYGLPASVQNLINDICVTKQVPVEFVLSPLLVAAGTAAGSNAILDGRGYVNCGCLWNAVIADAGANKSYPQSLLLEPLENYNKSLISDGNLAMREWRAECAKSGKSTGTAMPQKPAKTRIIVNDTTREGLAEILAGSPCGVCQVRDELSGFLSDIGRYGKSGEMQDYLSFWSGKGSSIDRKSSDETILIDRVMYNLCGTIQPAMLSDAFTRQHIGSGFVSRFCFFWPQSIPVKKIEINPANPDMSLWHSLINKLCSMRGQETRLTLSQQANEVCMAFEQEIEVKKADSSFPSHLKGVLSKLSIIVLRLACIARMLAIADGDFSREVSEEEMRWSVDLCQYLFQTSMRVHDKLNCVDAPQTDADVIRSFYQRFKDKGVSQGNIAKMLGTSQQYVGKCVNSK